MSDWWVEFIYLRQRTPICCELMTLFSLVPSICTYVCMLIVNSNYYVLSQRRFLSRKQLDRAATVAYYYTK